MARGPSPNRTQQKVGPNFTPISARRPHGTVPHGFRSQVGSNKVTTKGVQTAPGTRFHGGPVQRHAAVQAKSNAGGKGRNTGNLKLPKRATKGGKPPAGGKPPPGKPTTTTTHPPAATPYLTPAQQAALNQYDTGYGYKIGKLNRTLSDATANTNQALAQAARQQVAQSDQANQAMAARGLFTSSIRDADLNDIDAALAMRNNILNTNLNRLALDTNAQSGALMSDWVTQHNLYNSLAVTNAQAQTPQLPVTTTNTTGGAGGAGGTGGKTGGKGGGNPSGSKRPGSGQHGLGNLDRWRQGIFGPIRVPGMGGRPGVGMGQNTVPTNSANVSPSMNLRPPQ